MNNCIIYCTVPNEFGANLIATTLVEEKLAACVNIIPSITSIYRWEEDVQTDNEILLVIKTKENLYENVEKRIKDLHEYNVPEIIAVPITKGSTEYQNWIIKETK